MKLGRTLLVVLICLAVLAGVMLLLTFTIKSIEQVATGLASENKSLKGLGRVGIVIAGLAAPIIYLFQRIGKGIKGLFTGFGSSEKERTLGKRNEAMAKELTSLREQVRLLDQKRSQELAASQARVEKLEVATSLSQQRLAASEARTEVVIERLAHPQVTHTNAELLEIAKRSPYQAPGPKPPEEPH